MIENERDSKFRADVQRNLAEATVRQAVKPCAESRAKYEYLWRVSIP
jgi:hypothetical protein